MDKVRAPQLVARIDANPRWEQKTAPHKDQKFAELGKHPGGGAQSQLLAAGVQAL